MPAINDYDKNEDGDDELNTSGGYIPPTGAQAGPQVQQASNQKEEQYVPWSRFVDANKSVTDREAGKLQSGVQGDVNAAQSGRDAAATKQQREIDSNYIGAAAARPRATQGPGFSNAWASFFPDASASQPAQPAQGLVGGRTPKLGSGGLQSQQQADNAELPQGPAQSSGFGVAGPSRAQQTAGAGLQLQPPAAQPAAPADVSVALAPQAPPGTPQGTVAVAPGSPQATAKSAEVLNYFSNLKSGAMDHPVGSKDLESELGPDAWASLLGKTTAAGNEANALGSESGVQALLQRNQAAPTDSAFDAALINGAGQRGFADINKQFGKGQLTDALATADQASQDRWAKLQGDVTHDQNVRRQLSDAAANAPAAAAPEATDKPAADPSTAAPKLSVSMTSGANGQWDDSQIPSGFDPSSDAGYQSAMQVLQQKDPLPSWATTPFDFLQYCQKRPDIFQGWVKDLGVSGEQLGDMILKMPQWQWELFARGIVPSSLQRGSSGQNGYFQGFMPVHINAEGAGTSPGAKPYLDAMNAVLDAVAIAAGGPIGAAYVAAHRAAVAAGTAVSGGTQGK